MYHHHELKQKKTIMRVPRSRITFIPQHSRPLPSLFLILLILVASELFLLAQNGSSFIHFVSFVRSFMSKRHGIKHECNLKKYIEKITFFPFTWRLHKTIRGEREGGGKDIPQRRMQWTCYLKISSLITQPWLSNQIIFLLLFSSGRGTVK